jgi:hypothetical protein
LCQNGCLSVFSSIKETEKDMGVGEDSHVVFGKKKIPGEIYSGGPYSVSA